MHIHECVTYKVTGINNVTRSSYRHTTMTTPTTATTTICSCIGCVLPICQISQIMKATKPTLLLHFNIKLLKTTLIFK